MIRRPASPKDDAPQDPGKRARKAAMRLLERREFSAAELRRRLAARGIDEGDAGEAVAALGAAGWQNDGRFAESMVRARASRGYGPLRIAAELKAQGVAQDIIAQTLDGWASEWCARAAEARRKRFGAAPPADWREQARQRRFLEYRGFEQDHIRNAMQEGEAAAFPRNDDRDL